MQFLRQNTAVKVTVGPFYDKTDGVTIETALTITNERITLTADTDDDAAPTNILDNVTGATSGTANDLNYISGNDAGLMSLELSAANTNRVGRCLLSITDAANHVPVFHEYFILPQVIYDWLTAGAAPLTPTTAGRTLDVSAGGEAGVDWANVGSPTTTLGLSGTTVKTVTDIATQITAVVGALADAAADGAVTSADTLMAYVKQLINTLEGGPGIPTWPSAVAPGNAVSIAEALRATYDASVAIKAITDAIGATAAAKLAQTLGDAAGAVPFTIAVGATNTTIATDLAEATNDHYVGRVILFKTGILAGQIVPITSYTATGGVLTYTNRTAESASNGDTGVIL